MLLTAIATGSSALFFLRNAQSALRSQLTQFPALRLSDLSFLL